MIIFMMFLFYALTLVEEAKQESRSRPWQEIQRLWPWQATSRFRSRQASTGAGPWQDQEPQSKRNPVGTTTTAGAPAFVNYGAMGTTPSATKAAALFCIYPLGTHFCSAGSSSPSCTAESVPEWRQFHRAVSAANAGSELCAAVWRFKFRWCYWV